MTRDEAARLFLDTPFVHQGRHVEWGIDCIGLLVCWGAVLSLPFVALDTTNYDKNPAFGLLETYLLSAFGPPLPVSEIRPGDVVSVNFKGAVRHVGIVAAHPDGGRSLIHTNSSVGRVTEARIDAKWLKRIAGVYRP